MTDVVKQADQGVSGELASAGGGKRLEFNIIPIRALPLVAAVIAGLIASIGGNWQWGLDFYHVVGGGLWTGIDLFVGFVVGPIIGRMSVPSRMEFSSRFMPKMLVIMPTVVTMTLGSGFQLARKLGYFNPGASQHGWLVASFIVVGVMTVIALGILEPANLAVLFELKKEQPNGKVIEKLMRRFIYTAGITGAMQIATLIIMTRVATL
ncbi:MAG: hypothetical protein M0Z96_05390 [Actinomycetota bacterium]|nr:hypothetical protein [Actinomycetota bacterium]